MIHGTQTHIGMIIILIIMAPASTLDTIGGGVTLGLQVGTGTGAGVCLDGIIPGIMVVTDIMDTTIITTIAGIVACTIIMADGMLMIIITTVMTITAIITDTTILGVQTGEPMEYGHFQRCMKRLQRKDWLHQHARFPNITD